MSATAKRTIPRSVATTASTAPMIANGRNSNLKMNFTKPSTLRLQPWALAFEDFRLAASSSSGVRS